MLVVVRSSTYAHDLFKRYRASFPMDRILWRVSLSRFVLVKGFCIEYICLQRETRAPRSNSKLGLCVYLPKAAAAVVESLYLGTILSLYLGTILCGIVYSTFTPQLSCSRERIPNLI